MKNLLLILAFVALAATAAPLKKIKIALNWKPEPQFGGFYAGVEQKIFQKHGFDLEIIPGGAGSPVSQLLESDNVDLGTVTGDEVVVGRSRGLSLKALFAVYQDFPQGVMIRASRGIDTFEKLFQTPGQIALQKGVAFSLFLEKKYGKQAAAKIVPYVGGIGLFEKDPAYSQQCFITSEPLIAEKKGLAVSVLPVARSGYNPYATVVVAKDSWIAKNKSHLRRLYQALDESWTAYLKNPTSTNRLMQKLNPAMDADTFTKSANVQKSLIANKDGLGLMTKDRWQTLATQLKDLGIVPQVEANAENYFEAIWKNPD